MNGREIIYWDACIFIAHLKDEQRQNPRDMQGVNELANLFDQGQLELTTSTITITEVLESTISPVAYRMFRSLFSRRNFHLIEVSREIAEISHEIRNFYYDESMGQPTVKTPDAIHLATAIWFQCGVFYTFDGTAGRGLIQLSQPIANQYPLNIQKPTPNQPPQLPLNF